METEVKTTKVCTKCGVEKDLTCFSKHKRYKDGLKSWCKKCNNIYAEQYRTNNVEKLKQYRQNNSEKLKERSRQWYKDNFERAKEKLKQYRQNNSEKLNEVIERWRKNNPERVKETKKQWQKNNREKVNAYSKRYYKENSEKVNERTERWRRLNLEKVRKKQIQYRKKNFEKVREWAKQQWCKHIANVSKYYAKDKLIKKGFRKEDITDELINVQQLIIKTKRLCKTSHN